MYSKIPRETVEKVLECHSVCNSTFHQRQSIQSGGKQLSDTRTLRNFPCRSCKALSVQPHYCDSEVTKCPIRGKLNIAQQMRFAEVALISNYCGFSVLLRVHQEIENKLDWET